MQRITSIALLSASLFLLGACNQEEKTSVAEDNSISVDLSLPNSLTGGRSSTSSAQIMMRAANSVAQSNADLPCAFIGSDHDNPFDNGYEMTKFMVQVIATWSCVADTIINAVDNPAFPHDGTIVATNNVFGSSTYDGDEPTHYSVTQDNGRQTSLRLYYGYAQSTPPTSESKAGVYLSWDGLENDDVQGKMIFDLDGLTPVNRDPTDPVRMRMDFSHGSALRQASMYLEFDNNNPFANGLRIEVSKDLTALATQHVYTARGLLDVKAQFMPADGITELPQLRMYTVADAFGEGAALAEMSDVSLPLLLDQATNNNLGNYLFSKVDQYYFDADQSLAEPWDYINKQVTTAVYRGGRTTQEASGSPSLADIRSFLGLSNTYFIGSECGDLNSNCTDLINAIFQSGYAAYEKNQGAIPSDWRAAAIADAQYLTSVYPDGSSDWTMVFDMTFTPSAL